MKKLLLLLALTSACTPNLPRYTVMITNLAENSGGSGTVLENGPLGSTVLTNRHVCELIKVGGIVQNDLGSAFVVAYKMSEVHDLCLIRVGSDLGHSTSLANDIPVPYEKTYVSGHPHLLPTIITEGHISGKRVIQVMIGVRECTAEEMSNPSTGFFCAVVGKMPIVRSFEAVAISNIIQPGSSGSGVYNTGGRVAAVVFAGDGDMAFGYAIPLEYVYMFVKIEAKQLPFIKVDPTIVFSNTNNSRKDFVEKATKVCVEASPEVKASIARICRLFLPSDKLSDMIFRGN